MDQETLTNHISKLRKHYFDNACKIVLKNVFNLHPTNVDGKNDGGTDIGAFNRYGESLPVAYQITTQKTDIKNKAYKDAEKAIGKLGVEEWDRVGSFFTICFLHGFSYSSAYAVLMWIYRFWGDSMIFCSAAGDWPLALNPSGEYS